MSLAERRDEESEERLAGFWNAYVDRGRGGPVWLLRHARATARALADLRRLPVATVEVGEGPGGRPVRAVLSATGTRGFPARLLGTAVLEVPAEADDYLEGRPARTLRRKVRAAERQGVKVRPVHDEQERRALVARTEDAERHHVDPAYRVPHPDNSDLLDHDLWLLAEADGQPLLLAVAPYDGECAVLRYFRTFDSGEAQSDARYLATAELVRALSERGVRYLLDTATPPEQTNGLRHFQRMVGFRYARFRLGRAALTGRH